MDACREYAQQRNWDVYEYYDEGFSGKDTERPDFQRLLQDIKEKRIDHVIFYKLDRISRKILDILDFIELTNQIGIDFISITENFDTTTPLGRAMVYIAATFAQLEREMLQQRVQDNMLRLAKTGRWLGGITPTGYRSKQVAYMDENGRNKYKYTLEEIPEELEIVKTIYQKYLQFKSLGRVERYLENNKIQTKNGKRFRKQTIKDILVNPVYIKSDPVTYKYFKDLDMEIGNPIQDFDGVHGLLTYNKHHIKKGQGNKIKDYSQWILSVGSHKGIIDGTDWIEIHKLLSIHGNKTPKKTNSHVGLLSGLIQCECGGWMKIKYGQKNKKTGTRFYYYVCENKRKGKKCIGRNLSGEMLDKMVLEIIKNLFKDKNDFSDYIKKVDEQYFIWITKERDKIEKMNKAISEKNHSIENLIGQLETPLSPIVSDRIKKRIEALELEIKEHEKSIKYLLTNRKEFEAKPIDFSLLKEKLYQLPHLLDKITDKSTLKNIIMEMVDRIEWKDEQIEIWIKEEK